jgi:RNA polymerase sigma-70 factor (ECF subfamily)
MFNWLSSTDSSDTQAVPSTNDEWVAALEGPDPDAAALEELRATLVRGLRAALQKRVPRRADTLAEDFAQDALVKILDKLDTFRGESQFTTWAQKIAVRTALSELRRKRWNDVSLDDVVSEDADGPTMPGVAASSEVEDDPAASTSQRLMMDRVQRILQEELTERQRTAVTAVMHDMPLQEVANRMGTTRNALYKAIYDGRQKVKSALEDEGIAPDRLLAELS